MKVDHTIWNGRWWDDGGPVEAYPGSGGPHRDHVHVAFKDDHLEREPYAFDALLPWVVAAYVTGGDGAGDRQDGIHGKAFDRKRSNVRLTRKQRQRVLLKNMGMEGA